MVQSTELFQLGAQQIIEKKYAEAVSSLSEADSLDPNDADIQELLSIAYTQLGVEQANSYNPFDQASAEPDMGIYSQAAENLKKAIEINPNNTAAKKNLSILIAAWGRSIAVNFPHYCYDDAMERLEEAVELDPEDADTKLLLSTVKCMKLASDKLREENDEEAICDFRKALEVDPDIEADLCAVIHTEIAKAQIKLGLCKEALISVRKALEIDPDCESAKNNLVAILGHVGVALLKDQKCEEAIVYLTEAFELDPECQSGNLNMPETSADFTEQYRWAIGQMFNAARRNLTDAYAMLGHQQFDAGEREKAFTSLAKALEVDPMNDNAKKVLSVIWTQIGKEHSAEGFKEEAIGDFKTAIKYYSQNERAKVALTELEQEEALAEGDKAAEALSPDTLIKQRILEPLQKYKDKGKISGKSDVEIRIKTKDLSAEDITKYCVDELHLFEVDIEFFSQICSISISPEALGILGIVDSC